MNNIFENEDGSIVAKFGTGALGVGGCFEPNTHEVLGLTIWELDKPVKEIGVQVLDKPTPTDELNERIRLTFTDSKSVDVVMAHLTAIKHCLESGDSVDGYDKAKNDYFESV